MRHESPLHENDIATPVVEAAICVHKALGPGLFEIVYEVSVAHELKRRGLFVQRQVPIAIEYEGIRFQEGFRADVLVEGKVMLELKAVEAVSDLHRKQLLTYLRLTDLRLGLLLLNFDEELINNGIHRIPNGMPQ